MLGIDPLPGPFDTVAGILMDRLGRIPGAGDSTVVAGWQLRVVRMDQRRVDRVAVAPAPERAQP